MRNKEGGKPTKKKSNFSLAEDVVSFLTSHKTESGEEKTAFLERLVREFQNRESGRYVIDLSQFQKSARNALLARIQNEGVPIYHVPANGRDPIIEIEGEARLPFAGGVE